MQMPAKSMHLSLHLDANLHCVDPGDEASLVLRRRAAGALEPSATARVFV